jgi:Pyridine nucleotide-disulphide oxidoreductase, dimerisation domain
MSHPHAEHTAPSDNPQGWEGIMGFTMLGPEAGEVMAVVQTAMLAGLPYRGLREAMFTHPTMAEGLVFLFANVPPNSAS